jgi:hypothetical protein
MSKLADELEEPFTPVYVILYFQYDSRFYKLALISERREHCVFTALLQIVPGLEDRLTNGGGGDVVSITEMVCLINLHSDRLVFTVAGVTKRCIQCSV